jgi:hypothetical protein
LLSLLLLLLNSTVLVSDVFTTITSIVRQIPSVDQKILTAQTVLDKYIPMLQVAQSVSNAVSWDMMDISDYSTQVMLQSLHFFPYLKIQLIQLERPIQQPTQLIKQLPYLQKFQD